MKAEKRTRKQYDEAFKRDAVALVLDQGHKVTNAGPAAWVSPNLIIAGNLSFGLRGQARFYRSAKINRAGPRQIPLLSVGLREKNGSVSDRA